MKKIMISRGNSSSTTSRKQREKHFQLGSFVIKCAVIYDKCKDRYKILPYNALTLQCIDPNKPHFHLDKTDNAFKNIMLDVAYLNNSTHFYYVPNQRYQHAVLKRSTHTTDPRFLKVRNEQWW